MLPAGIISSGGAVSAGTAFDSAALTSGVFTGAGAGAGAVAGNAGTAGNAGITGTAGPAAGPLVLAGAGKRRVRLGAWRTGVFCAQSSKPVKNKIRTSVVVFI